MEELISAGHVMHRCAADCSGCMYCDGGLAFCVNCKRGEAEFWDDNGKVIVCECSAEEREPLTDITGCDV